MPTCFKSARLAVDGVRIAPPPYIIDTVRRSSTPINISKRLHALQSDVDRALIIVSVHGTRTGQYEGEDPVTGVRATLDLPEPHEPAYDDGH